MNTMSILEHAKCICFSDPPHMSKQDRHLTGYFEQKGWILVEAGMVSVFDVARYLLSRIGEMSTMRLEKLAYYCQAWSLAWDGVPLFPEDFEAWANGPVCPQLFQTHADVLSVDKDYYGKCDLSLFSPEQIETMDAVIDGYGNRPGIELSRLTHLENPWKETRGSTPHDVNSHKIIEKDLIQEYYGGIRDA